MSLTPKSRPRRSHQWSGRRRKHRRRVQDQLRSEKCWQIGPEDQEFDDSFLHWTMSSRRLRCRKIPALSSCVVETRTRPKPPPPRFSNRPHSRFIVTPKSILGKLIQEFKAEFNKIHMRLCLPDVHVTPIQTTIRKVFSVQSPRLFKEVLASLFLSPRRRLENTSGDTFGTFGNTLSHALQVDACNPHPWLSTKLDNKSGPPAS